MVLQTMLLFQHPSLGQPYELGWDDCGHWHPHVLRWEELEKIITFLTMNEPEHFVVPFLLFLPFTLITKQENEREIARKIKAAWRSLALFSEEEIEHFDRQIPYIPEFSWSYSQKRSVYHVCDAEWDIYSKRHICSGDFPFEAFEDLIRTIDAHKETVQWQEAIHKWDKLIQAYGHPEDEYWFERRETADYYHTSQ